MGKKKEQIDLTDGIEENLVTEDDIEILESVEQIEVFKEEDEIEIIEDLKKQQTLIEEISENIKLFELEKNKTKLDKNTKILNINKESDFNKAVREHKNDVPDYAGKAKQPI